MKKILTFMITGSIVLFFMMLTSCDKDETIVTTTNSVVDGSKVGGSNARVTALAATTTYGITPAVGGFTTNSTSTTTLSGDCGSYTGGIIRAQVLSQSGSTFVIRISKQNGTTFSVAGTAKVKSSSVCRGLAGSANYSILNKSVDVTINATFAKGITHFYPVVESATGGTKYYAEPVIVYTSPTYTMSSINGTVMGTVNGVEVRSSGLNNQNLTSLNQCTEFCQRYYSQVYVTSFSINVWGDATDWMNNLDTRFEKQTQGQINPRVGDILCFGGGTTTPSKPQGYGHVAIITEVSNTEVKFAHQNGGTGGYLDAFIPIGGRVSRNGGSLSMISPTTTLYVKGIIRKKP